MKYSTALAAVLIALMGPASATEYLANGGFESGDFLVETLDAPLVTLGVKSPLYFSNRQPDMTAGVHCNLFNNAWGTNYIMWFGEDMRFRFILRA